MVIDPLVYFVLGLPKETADQNGKVMWRIHSKGSLDGGKTVEDLVHYFDTQENAVRFKRDVNYATEPVKLEQEK